VRNSDLDSGRRGGIDATQYVTTCRRTIRGNVAETQASMVAAVERCLAGKGR